MNQRQFSAAQLIIVLCLLAVAFPAHGQEKLTPVNRNVLRWWYEKQKLAAPRTPESLTPSVSTEVGSSFPDQPDVHIYPSANPQTENSIAVSPLNPDVLFISTNGRA